MSDVRSRVDVIDGGRDVELFAHSFSIFRRESIP
jgi:hypothetical protein